MQKAVAEIIVLKIKLFTIKTVAVKCFVLKIVNIDKNMKMALIK